MWLINRAATLQWGSTSIYIEKTETWESLRGAETNVGPEKQWKKGITGATRALLQREAGHFKELKCIIFWNLIRIVSQRIFIQVKEPVVPSGSVSLCLNDKAWESGGKHDFRWGICALNLACNSNFCKLSFISPLPFIRIPRLKSISFRWIFHLKGVVLCFPRFYCSP